MFLVLVLLVAGCKYVAPEHRQQAKLRTDVAGNWVCATMLGSAVQRNTARLQGDLPPYTELIFMPDSGKVVAINGQVEILHLSYTIQGSKVIVPDFYAAGSANLMLENDSVLVFNDEVTGQEWRYAKVSSAMVNTEGQVHEAFPTMMNKSLLAGDYVVLNASAPYAVTLRPNGYIFGSPTYTRYAICYGGDCANFSDDDLLYLSNGRQGEYYGWRKSGDTLTIYRLSEVHEQDEMTSYKFDKPLLVMKRK